MICELCKLPIRDYQKSGIIRKLKPLDVFDLDFNNTEPSYYGCPYEEVRCHEYCYYAFKEKLNSI